MSAQGTTLGEISSDGGHLSMLMRRRHLPNPFGHDMGMLGRKVSLGIVVWLVIGMVVAANHRFLDHPDSLSRILSAALAVGAWPLVVLRIHVAI